jgi:hypothetical protein
MWPCRIAPEKPHSEQTYEQRHQDRCDESGAFHLTLPLLEKAPRVHCARRLRCDRDHLGMMVHMCELALGNREQIQT